MTHFKDFFGNNTTACLQMECCLFDRSQYLKMGASLSDTGRVRFGVPQGLLIGPLLFTLFYNDFPSCLKHSEIIIHADDTVILVPGKDVVIIEARLPADMNKYMNGVQKTN